MVLGQKIASLYAEIGADTSKLDSGLKSAKKGLSSLERDFIKGGKTFGSLSDDVNAFSKTLKSATPQNIRFAQRFGTIQKALDRGKISIGDAQQAIGRLKSEMGAAAPLSSKLASGIQSLAVPAGIAAGAIVGIGAALKTAFDIGQQGALITQTRESFAGLLVEIGAAPDLLDRLKKASRGTVDEMSLMSSTATLLAGTQGDMAVALANATPQLLEIAKAANKLNPSLGDTTFLYDSLAKGIKRAQPEILDNLGVVISVGDAYAEFATSIGKATNELTKDEQAQAILNATLAKGRILIDQAGNSADSGADAYGQLATNLKDATNELKELVNRGVLPAIKATNEYLQVTRSSNDMVEQAKFLFDEGAISSRTYGIILRDLISTSDGVETASLLLSEAQEAYNKKLNAGTLQVDEFEKSQTELNKELAKAPNIAGKAAEQYNTYAYQAGIAEDANRDLEESTWGINEAMKSYSERLLFAELSQNLTADAALYVGQQLGLVDENTVKLYKEIPKLTEAYDTNKDGMIDLDEAMRGAAEAAIGLHTNLSKIPGTYQADVRVQYYESGGINTLQDAGAVKETGGSEFQHGGSFVVPTGYPNDTFVPNIRLTSGERVDITPAYEPGEKSGDNRPITVNIMGDATRDNAALLARQIGAELDRQARYH